MIGDTSISAALESARTRLRTAGTDDPERDAARLLASCLGPFAEARQDMLTLRDAQRFEAMIERRAKREPVSRIVGRRDFWTLSFGLSADVFDPRPDSETLVQTACALYPGDDSFSVWDMGCGSGCLLGALLSERPAARGLGVDISPSALAMARSNLARNGLLERSAFIASDWFAALHGRAHMILANPPYIRSGDIADLADEVRVFDPLIALDGGADGLDPLRLLAGQAPAHLHAGGHFIAEIGAGQKQDAFAIFTSSGLYDIGIHDDMNGTARVISGRRVP